MRWKKSLLTFIAFSTGQCGQMNSELKLCSGNSDELPNKMRDKKKITI